MHLVEDLIFRLNLPRIDFLLSVHRPPSLLPSYALGLPGFLILSAQGFDYGMCPGYLRVCWTYPFSLVCSFVVFWALNSIMCPCLYFLQLIDCLSLPAFLFSCLFFSFSSRVFFKATFS